MSYCSECKLSSGIHDSGCPAIYKRSLRIIKQKLATANSRNKELEAEGVKLTDLLAKEHQFKLSLLASNARYREALEKISKCFIAIAKSLNA